MALDKEDLQQLGTIIGDAVADAVKSIGGGAESNLTPDERAGMAMSDLRGGPERAERFKWEKRVACKSPISGNTFTAVVQGNNFVRANGKDIARDIHADTIGRVVQLDKYEIDPGYFVHQSEGGRVPDGMAISQNPLQRGQFDQFLYDSGYKADATMYAGKPLAQGLSLEEQCKLEVVQKEAAAVAETARAAIDENAVLKARIAELEAKGSSKRASP